MAAQRASFVVFLMLIMSTIPIYYFRFLSCHGSALAVAVCIPAKNPSLDEGVLLLMYIAAQCGCRATNACDLQNMVKAIKVE
jgi:hypothetical protein